MRFWFVAGSFLGALAVLAGAFGAHGLEGKLTPRLMEVYHTAARYHLAHSLALLAVAFAGAHFPGPWVSRAGGLLLAGTLIFCGSLYTLSLTGIRALGAIAPLGGTALVAGWISLGLAALRSEGRARDA